MKVILTEKITKLGNIGDTVEVKTGFARNYLLPNGKAMRFTRENVALFEAKKAELTARQEAAKKNAEANVDAVKNAKLHMIRQAGDTGQLYGSVSTRDIARMLKEVANVSIESAQVMLGAPIKSVGAFDTTIALHPDVIVPVKIYVAQTQDEIDALVAGKSLTFGTKKVEEVEEEVVAEHVKKAGHSVKIHLKIQRHLHVRQLSAEILQLLLGVLHSPLGVIHFGVLEKAAEKAAAQHVPDAQPVGGLQVPQRLVQRVHRPISGVDGLPYLGVSVLHEKSLLVVCAKVCYN